MNKNVRKKFILILEVWLWFMLRFCAVFFKKKQEFNWLSASFPFYAYAATTGQAGAYTYGSIQSCCKVMA